MSEEMKEVIISVTPEIEFDIGVEGTGAPTGSASPMNNVDKPVPHYLRASTRSCHDFCKFGLKHDSEVKKMRPVFPRRLSNNLKPNAVHDQTNTGVHRQRRKRELSLRKYQKNLEPTGGHKVIKQMDLPPEKIIQLPDSPTHITEASYQEPINLNDEMSDKNFPPYVDEESSEGSVSIKCMIPSSILKGNESGEHESANPSKELFDGSVSLNYDGTPTGSFVDIGGNTPLIQEGESPLEESSTQMSIGSVEHAMNGVERSSDKTPKEITQTERNINKSTTSGNHKSASNLGGTKKPASPMTSKTPVQRIRSMAMYHSPVSRAGRSFPEQTQVKRSNIGYKSKREVYKPKNTHKGLEDIDIPSASNGEQTDELAVPTGTKKNVAGTPDGAVKLKAGAEIKKLSMTKPDASVKLMMHKKSILSTQRVMGASVESASPMKLKKVVLKSSYSSTSLAGLTGRRNRHKTTNIAGHSNDGDEEKVAEVQLTLTSTKHHLNRVSSLKLKKLKSVSPSMTVKNQTKVGRSGSKERTLHATELMNEKVDLKAMKQKLRKHAAHSLSRKEEQQSEVNESTPHREVIGRNSRDFPSELRLKHRRIASNQSVERLSKALNFSRSKVIKFQPENTTPAWLRFMLNKASADRPSARRMVGKASFGKRVEEGHPDSKNSSLECPTIALRHADVQDKKEVQGLFNNVIEETASKLVESRKSKVKALVGAFETVISLQESKTPVSAP